ncbi:archease [bacterium]|nr:archease [bacterium]NIN91492.1 archease [bacterium]NIO17897.1 archease [bacterium]NIO72878.1 archease [bacterium]
MKRFELIEHTADMGIKAYGKDMGELFTNAAYGMASSMTDLEKVNPKESQDISLEAENREELLVSWLNEIIYLSASKTMLFSKFEVSEIDDRHLKAKIFGEGFDIDRHKIETEFKAATYHRLKISNSTLPEGVLQAEIIFDI